MPEETPNDDEPEDAEDLDDFDDLDEDEFRSWRRPRSAEREAPAKDIPPSAIELEKIPQRLWEQTLVPLHRQQRYWVAHQVGDEALRKIAGDLAFNLDMAECRRRDKRLAAQGRARRAGFPLPTPPADHPTRRASTQVNMRLRADDRARLAQAAEAVGCRPTTLARSLVLNGVAMILRDHALER